MEAGMRAPTMAAGAQHSLVLRDDGEIVAFGKEFFGRLRVPKLPSGKRYTSVAAGADHTLALRDDGQVMGVGVNSHGQCRAPALPDGHKYVAVSAGGAHSLALRDDGALLPFGCGDEGQCAVPELPSGRRWTGVAARGWHSLALLDDGQLFAFGRNKDGQCDVPALPAGCCYTAAAAGGAHSLALRDDGNVVAFGRNLNGQCEVPELEPGMHYTAVAAGGEHSMVLRSDGQAFAFGADAFGQCGVPSLTRGQAYVQIAAGDSHSLTLRADGEVQAFGSGGQEQCRVPPLPVGRSYTVGSASSASQAPRPRQPQHTDGDAASRRMSQIQSDVDELMSIARQNCMDKDAIAKAVAAFSRGESLSRTPKEAAGPLPTAPPPTPGTVASPQSPCSPFSPSGLLNARSPLQWPGPGTPGSAGKGSPFSPGSPLWEPSPQAAKFAGDALPRPAAALDFASGAGFTGRLGAAQRWRGSEEANLSPVMSNEDGCSPVESFDKLADKVKDELDEAAAEVAASPMKAFFEELAPAPAGRTELAPTQKAEGNLAFKPSAPWSLDKGTTSKEAGLNAPSSTTSLATGYGAESSVYKLDCAAPAGCSDAIPNLLLHSAVAGADACSIAGLTVGSGSQVEPERFPICSGSNHVVLKLAVPEDIRAIPAREVNLSPRRSLGKGSFGEVMRGRWRGRDVAVKYVYGDKDVTFDMVSTFMKEVEMLKRCQHQFVVQVLGFSLAPRLMIIMEMCTCSLSDRLHRHSSSPKLLEKLWLLGDAALGVAYLHLQQVVHRDLKPANILLVEEGFDDDCDRIYTAKVADFSLARVKTGGSTTQGKACGTPHYMAPELLCIKPSFSYKSDVYAFGVIMWETSTGKVPYSEQPDLHVMMASVRNGEREDNEQADVELKYLIESCWDQEPSRRPDFDTIVRSMPGGPSASGSRLPSK